MNKENLIEVLRKAGMAHGDYEVNILKGVYDDNWPLWYAAYVVGALGMETIRPSVLTTLLAEADKAHQKQDPRADWAVFYANYITDTLA